MLIMLSEIVMEVRSVCSQKAQSPMCVTLLGITVAAQPVINVLDAVSMIALQLLRESNIGLPFSTMMEVKLIQPENGPSPRLVTLFGIVMAVRLEHPKKALSPMPVTLLGIIVDEQPAIKLLVAVSMIALQLLRESYTGLPFSTTMETRLEQLRNASFPMLVRLLGIIIEVRPEQYPNAHSPMFVTLLGIVMDVRVLQPRKAESPMLVTLLGIVMELRLLQPRKAESPMLVTLYVVPW